MAKYLEHDLTGGMREKEGTTLAIANAIPALDATGRLTTAQMPVGIGADTAALEASESLSAGDWVNVWPNTTSMVRKADATTTGKEVTGFVLAAVTAGNTATVYFEGTNDQVSGLTPGAMQFLNTTAGGSTETAPSTTGNIVQKIGRALSATAVQFEPSNSIELA